MPLLIQTPTGPQVASEEEKAELLALLGPLPVGPQGLQGERGERGLSGADAQTQVTFANNLTTSDPTVGLAAPQGVALKAQIDSLAQTTSTGLQAAAAATTAAQAAAIAASAPVEHTHTLLITQAERDKLGTVAANATQNATDVALRDRTTHAGQQPISTVLGLQASLDNKADLIGGKLNPAQVPDIAIQQYLGPVANQVAMLALVGQSGDWCSRSDTGTVFIITGSPAVIGGWTQLSYPASAVQSVCGLVGVITVAQLGAALASLFASPTQGAKADSALQGIDDINTVLAGAAPAKLAVTQSLVSVATTAWARNGVVLGSPVARLSYLANTASNGTHTCGNYKVGFKVLKSATGPRLLYANRVVSNVPGTPESLPTNPITVRAGVELAGVIYPVFFGGRRDVVLDPGAAMLSDPVPCNITAGDILYARTCVSVSAAGMTWRTSGNYITTNASAIPGEGAVLSTTYQDLSTAGAIPAEFVYAYAPCGVLAVTGASVAVLREGDSITFGEETTLDPDTGSYRGYQKRLLDAIGVSHVNNALSGEQVAHYIQPGAMQLRTTLGMGQTHAICGYGINDINNSTRTLEQIQADLLTHWHQNVAAGRKVAQVTLVPCTASTDSWATTGGQTDKNARVTLLWAALNTWINTKPAPLSAVIPVGEAASSTPGVNAWKPGITSDGTHPNEAGHAALAADAEVISVVQAFLAT